MSENAGTPYCPSNGSEGMWFTDKYCMNCFHCDPDPEGEKQCEILMRSMMYHINEPEFPKEWIYNEEGKPSCSAYKKWDWGRDGNPDDPDNPNYTPPDDPNQLCLPFMINGIVPEKQLV